MADTHLYRQPSQPTAKPKKGNADPYSPRSGTASAQPAGNAYPPWPPADQFRGPPQFGFSPNPMQSMSQQHGVPPTLMPPHQPQPPFPNAQPIYTYPTPTSAQAPHMPLFVPQGLVTQGQYDAPMTAPPEKTPWREANTSDGKSAFWSLLEEHARHAYGQQLKPSSPFFPETHQVTHGQPASSQAPIQPSINRPPSLKRPLDGSHKTGSYVSQQEPSTWQHHSPLPPQLPTLPPLERKPSPLHVVLQREAETGSAITTTEEEVRGQVVSLLVDDAPPLRALYPPIDPTSVVGAETATSSALHSTALHHPTDRPSYHAAVSTSPEMLRKSSVNEVPHMTAEHHHMYNPSAPVPNDLYAHPVFQWTPTLLESEQTPTTAQTPASSKELIIREPALTTPLTGQTSKDVVYDIAGFIISDQADTALDRFSKGIEHHLAYLESVGINSNTILGELDDCTENDDVERATGRRDNIAGLAMAFDLDATQGSSGENGVFVKIAARPNSLQEGTGQMKIQFIADRHTANGTSLYFMNVDQTASGPEKEGRHAYHLSRYELEKTFVGDYLWIDPTNVVLGDSDGFLHLLQWKIPNIDGRAPSGTKRINVQPLAKLRAHQDGIREIAYQREMRWTLSGADVGGLVISDVNIWDQKKGRVSTLPIPSNASGVSTGWSIHSHVVKYALSCATDDGLFTLYDARTSRDVAGFESPVSIYSHTYTSDNMVYLGHSNGTICGYDLRSLRASRPVKDSMVTSIGYLDFNAESNMLMSMGFGGVTAWELSDRMTAENKSSVTPLRSMDLRDASRMRSISQTASFTVTGQFVDQTPHFAAITSDGIVALYDMLERNTTAK